MIETKKLGQAIGEIRRLRGLTQKAVAEKTGLTINFMSLIENGERSVSLETLNRLAKAFQVPAEWITFLAGGKPKNPAFVQLSEVTKEAIRAALTEKLNVTAS